MASSQKNSHSRPWPRGQYHYVDFDDWVKCCVAWSWNSYWVTLAHCKHSRIGSNEPHGCTRIDIITTCSYLSLHCPLECDGSFDCNSSTLDYNPNLVCLYVVACSSNSSVLEVKAQQGSGVRCLYGDDYLEHCVSCGVGGLFHLVEEPGTYWHYHRGSDWCGAGGLS